MFQLQVKPSLSNVPHCPIYKLSHPNQMCPMLNLQNEPSLSNVPQCLIYK